MIIVEDRFRRCWKKSCFDFQAHSSLLTTDYSYISAQNSKLFLWTLRISDLQDLMLFLLFHLCL